MNFKKVGILVVLLGVLITSFVLISGRVNRRGETSSIKKQPQVGGIQTKEEQVFKDIIPKDAYFLIRNNQGNQNFTIIDVRTPQEYSQGHLENAINLDYSSVGFKEGLMKLDKNKTYLIYCGTGRRSGLALDIMGELDFARVYNLSGGINSWQVEELPIVK